MKYGSLCTGAGGLDLAVEEVFGAQPAWFCESDKAAVKVLNRWWPQVPVLPDVRNQDWTSLESVEIVACGYPCQPFSQAGPQLGERDERNLWPYVLDAVRLLGPRVVVLENVAAHLGVGFGTVLGDLAQAGFDAEWTVVRASDVGACHIRARLFAVAYPRGGRFGEQSGEPSSEEAGAEEDHVAAGAGAGRAVADSDRASACTEPYERAQQPELGASRWGDARGRDAAVADSASSGWWRGTGLREGGPTGFGDGRSGDDDRETLADPNVAGREGPEPEERQTVSAWGDYEPAIRRHEQLVGRPAPVPADDRGRLTVDFVTWLMVLPEGWVAGLSRKSAFRCLGNAACPPQAVFAVQGLLQRLEGYKENDETDVSLEV